MEFAETITATDYDRIAIRLILDAFSPWIGLYMILFLGLPFWVVSLQAARALKRRIPPPLPGGLTEGLFLFAFCFLGHWMVIQILVLLFKGEDEGESLRSMSLLQNALIQGAVYLAALVYLARLQGLQGLRQAGFQWSRPGIVLSFGVAAYFAFYPLYLLAAFVNTWFVSPEPQELVRELMENPDLYSYLPVLLSAGFIVPLLEEVLFRGYLLSGLRAFMRPLPAILISAALFSFLHETQARIPVFALGCILGYVRERTGSLAPAVLVHSLHNSIMLAAIPFV